MATNQNSKRGGAPGFEAWRHAVETPPARKIPRGTGPLSELVIILTCVDDGLILEMTDLLRKRVHGLTVIAAPDSEILKRDNSDIQIFLGDTSVESQAELCVQRALREFGRIDALISIGQETVDETGTALSVDDPDVMVRPEDGEMRISEFDHLLYSKIRSVYLLSRFVRRTTDIVAETNRSLRVGGGKFIFARKLQKANEVTPLHRDTRAVLCATRAWMKSFAEASPHGDWMSFTSGEEFLENLARAFTSKKSPAKFQANEAHLDEMPKPLGQ